MIVSGMAFPPFLTTQDAARLLGCTRGRIIQLCAAGRIAGRRHGWAWIVDRTSALAYRRRRPGPKTGSKSKSPTLTKAEREEAEQAARDTAVWMDSFTGKDC
jgi:hypothetical protein